MENTTTFTKENILEYLRCEKDPIYFIKKYYHVQHPTKGSIQLDLYPYQEDVIRAYENNQHNVALTSRQVGITATSCAYLLWYAMFKRDKTILAGGDSGQNARDIIYRIKYGYDFLPDWFKELVTIESFNKHSIDFDNGSRIISQSITANCGHGMSISLLYADCMAFVEPDVQDEFWTSVIPCLLANGASSIITSVPNTDKDRFSKIWRQAIAGVSSFNPIRIDWDTPPNRDATFKKEALKLMGEARWRQEYCCEFVNVQNPEILKNPKKYQG